MLPLHYKSLLKNEEKFSPKYFFFKEKKNFLFFLFIKLFLLIFKILNVPLDILAQIDQSKAQKNNTIKFPNNYSANTWLHFSG